MKAKLSCQEVDEPPFQRGSETPRSLQSAPQGSAAAAPTPEAGGPDYSCARNGQCTAAGGQGERWSSPVACAPSPHMTCGADRKVGGLCALPHQAQEINTRTGY